MPPHNVQMLNGALGLIPYWQFSPDPRVNPNLNPNVVAFPPDASPTPGPIGVPMAGLRLSLPGGMPMTAGVQATQMLPANYGQGLQPGPPSPPQPLACGACLRPPTFGYGVSPPQLGFSLPIVDSWWWQHRKSLAVGTGAVILAAAAITVSAIVR